MRRRCKYRQPGYWDLAMLRMADHMQAAGGDDGGGDLLDDEACPVCGATDVCAVDPRGRPLAHLIEVDW